MTGKRFYIAESNLIEGYCVFDREKKYAFHPRPRKADCLNDAHILNELHDENEQLKESKKELQFQLNICADHRNEFHRGARENANEVGKLKKENKRLTNRVLECEAIIYALKKKYGADLR